MSKSPDAFRTISEVSEWLDTPTYVLRFWESRFPQIKPVKRAGGRRYYRPEDMMLLGGIKKLLHFDELTIKAAKALLKDKGVKHVMELSPDINTPVVTPQSSADAADKADIAKMVQETAQDAPKAKPAVEVRVVKKAKPAAEPEEETIAPAAAEPVTESAPSPEETPMTQDTPEEEPAVAKTKADTPAPQEPAQEPADAAETDATDAGADTDADTVSDPAMQAKATEAERQAAAQQAAQAKAAADEEAEDWAGLVPDMVMNAPYRIGTPDDYDSKTMGEIEMLYYSLRMARNKMRRSINQRENRPS
ncbi:MerR family transcriptional regulator [Neptunicoccus sediminis]|uniref:MerR family transcriptional regulator n=1 Tax=Neptunicoccus sediminis TaxID=1892596 RepID=UPI0009F57234|nr:MerR family transcriptional regulator [Neptunicoccus sediminis]